MAVGVVVAAVTAASLTAPATAAPAPAPGSAAVPATAKQAAAEPIPVPFLGEFGFVVSAGTSGFLTNSNSGGGEVRWTRYDTGASTVVAQDAPAVDGSMSGVVVVGDDHFQTARVLTLHDMATGAAPVVIDLRTLGSTARYVGVVGSTVLVRTTNADGTMKLHLVTKDGGVLSHREVSGLPADAKGIEGADTLRDAGLVRFHSVVNGTSKTVHAVVDVAAGRVTESYSAPTGSFARSHLTQDRVAWLEPAGATQELVSTKRGTGEVLRTPLSGLNERLLGDWVAYSQGEWKPFVARPLAGGEPVKLLDHALNTTVSPDGSLLVRGGTLEKGEGLYRIAPGADGTPAAEMVASTGRPTALTYERTGIPDVIDLTAQSGVPLTWKLSTTFADVRVGLTHKATGRTFWQSIYLNPDNGNGGYYPDGFIGFHWNGEFGSDSRGRRTAYNGEYTWSLTATPQNGIGPGVTATGGFKVVRKAGAHDYTDNGSPDLFARNSDGVLKRIDTTWDEDRGRLIAGEDHKDNDFATGWNIYDRIESVGDIAGKNPADTVARDKSGVLWLHRGTGSDSRTGFEPRVRIGGGWNTYTQFTGGSDLTGDGRSDLVATDKAGDLWLYRSTGDILAPFAPRKKIGHGWGVYNQITATGNLGGNATGDLVARDKNGALWLYLGNGDGTFAARRLIGGGWNQYAHIVGIGDANEDGRPDLYGRGPENTSFFYAGTGDWKAPFRTRTYSEVTLQEENDPYDKPFDHVF
ncbi:FG-GAP repeat domain-containing protein [Streptomyces sp. NPDC056480]|uniref:FG-GAP repeat domain-containing protein n=1 Tax=Streptomyces sp. NPDC056480 TaxID=3345833 RepID=UPI003682BF9E